MHCVWGYREKAEILPKCPWHEQVSHISLVKAQSSFPAVFAHTTNTEVGLALFFMNENPVQIAVAVIVQAQVAIPNASSLILSALQ